MKNEKLALLLKNENLDETTTLYRHSLPKFLEQTDEGTYRLSANEAATEMVEDLYGSGHLIMAKYVGKGLAFTLQKETEYSSDEKLCVKISLKDILNQEGLVYPDRSSYDTSSYFLTMPTGSVAVQKV